MTVTLKDVARRAGVSIPTVSLIINGRDLPFKESTRRAVLEAVEALNYRPDSMARRTANKSNRRDAVALLLRSESASRVSNAPVYEFICGVNDVLMERDQFLVMMKLHQLEQRSGGPPPRVIAERFIDGLIVETGLPEELEEAVARYRIPTVRLNTNLHGASDCIYPDEEHAGRLVTDHLLDLGHRAVAFVAPVGAGWPDAHFSVRDRQSGYEQAMAARRLAPRVLQEVRVPDPQAERVGAAVGTTSADLSAAAAAVAASRATDAPVTGVVTYDIGQAIRLIANLREAGLACPADVSVVAADDLRYLRRMWPDLSGVTCDRYQMGRGAAEMMLAKIGAGNEPQPSRVFRGALITGGTTAAPVVEAVKTSGKPRRAAKSHR
jgi:LacI family transcriptional regulator